MCRNDKKAQMDVCRCKNRESIILWDEKFRKMKETYDQKIKEVKEKNNYEK